MRMRRRRREEPAKDEGEAHELLSQSAAASVSRSPAHLWCNPPASSPPASLADISEAPRRLCEAESPAQVVPPMPPIATALSANSPPPPIIRRLPTIEHDSTK